MINPGELQCDDWVLIKESGCLARVVKTSKDTICVQDFGELSCDRCDGVRLTTKHLIRIGFFYLQIFKSYCLFEDSDDDIRVLIKLKEKENSIMLSGTVLELKYIHQLQHLLRLVGKDVESQVLEV